MATPSPRVVVIGIASMDIRGRIREMLAPATSNPGTVRITADGIVLKAVPVSDGKS